MIKNKITKSFIIIILLTFVLFPACDILRNEPFVVSSWSPGPGIHDESAAAVSVQFSLPPDHSSAEAAFSLTEDGAKSKGSFSWSGNSLFFTPAAPLSRNKDYELVVNTDAKTTDGLSLEERFVGAFSTRQGTEHPLFAGITPADESLVSDRWTKVTIDFSLPVDILSCINDISFSPAIRGTWVYGATNLSVVFEPAEQWKMGETYIVSIAPSFQSTGGKTLGVTKVNRFTVGDDTTAPVLQAVSAVSADGAFRTVLAAHNRDDALPYDTVGEFTGWEKDYHLELQFSENVNAGLLQQYITLSPSLNFNIDPPAGFADIITLMFTETPVWGKSYTITVQGGVEDSAGNKTIDTLRYKIRAEGANSKPPLLTAVRIPINPQDSSSVSYALFTKEMLYPPYDIPSVEFIDAPAWVELFFDTAPNARVDLLSLMDLFKVTATNTAFSFKPLKITNHVPEDTPAGYEHKICVRAEGKLSNYTRNGIVSFTIGKGLLDTAGNMNPSEMKIQISK